MVKHGQISQNKPAGSERKHHTRKNEPEETNKKSKKKSIDSFSLTETPFSPKMDEHVAILSKIPFSAQRENFILRLHETYGSRYVQRLMDSINTQPKLTVSDPNDIYEQEADRVADSVTKAINAPVQRQEEEEELLQSKLSITRQTEEEEELLQGTSVVQRQEEEEELIQGKFNIQMQSPEEEEELLQGKFDIQRQTPEEEEELLQGKLVVNGQTEEEEELVQSTSLAQRQAPEEEELQMQSYDSATSTIANDIETRINSARGGGHPLSDEVRNPMEQAFGADFSDLRVHTDPESDLLNQQISARAFTTGQDVFFREGEYSPGSANGQHLIAHELTHVIQQTGEQKKHGIHQSIQRDPDGDGDGEPKGELREEPEDEEVEKAIGESAEKGKKASAKADDAIKKSEGGDEKKKEAGVLGRLWNKHWKQGPTEKRVASTIGWLKTLGEGITQILDWAKVLELSPVLGTLTALGGIAKRCVVCLEKFDILSVYHKRAKVEKKIKPSGTLGFRTKEKTAAEYARDKVLRAATWGVVRLIESIVNFFISIFGDPTAKFVGGMIKLGMLVWQYGSRAIKAIVKEVKGIKGAKRKEASKGIYDEAVRLGPKSNAWQLVQSIMRLKYPLGNGKLMYDGEDLKFEGGFYSKEGDMGLVIVELDSDEIKDILYDSMSSKAETSIGLPGEETVEEIVG